jgi:hypothetical protein
MHRAGAAPALRVYVEPAAGVAPLVAFIDAARSRLDAEVYLASSKPVLAALERAASRGVRVQILLEQHPYGTGSAVPTLVYRSLQAHGVSVGWANPAFRYTHAKFLVEPDRGQVYCFPSSSELQSHPIVKPPSDHVWLGVPQGELTAPDRMEAFGARFLGHVGHIVIEREEAVA